MAGFFCVAHPYFDFFSTFASMKQLPILLFIWFSVLLVACSKPKPQSCPQEDLLYQMEGFYFLQKHDSALQILDTLNVDMLSEKERAHYCLLKVQIYDHYFKYDNETDSLLKVAEHYFIGGDDKFFEAETCKAISRIVFKKGMGEHLSLDWQQKALQSIEQCHHIDERFIRYYPNPITEQDFIESTKNDIRFVLGMDYLDHGYHNEGLQQLKLAEQYFSEKQNSRMVFETACMIGNAYLQNEEYDTCLLYYEKGREAAEQLNNMELCAYSHYSLSMFYRYKFQNHCYEDDGQGQTLLHWSISECLQGLALYVEPMFRYKDALFSDLSKSYFQLQQYDSCIYFADKQLEFMDEQHFEIVPNKENAQIFYRLYKSYEALGNTDEALKNANRYLELSENLEGDDMEVEKVKNEYDRKIEIQRLQTEQQTKRYRLYLMLSLAVAALLLILWMTFRYRKNKEIEFLEYREANRQLQSELENASQQSQKLLQLLQQRAMQIYKTKGDKAWQNIIDEFEATYPKATEHLKDAHPNLSEAERNIIILSFLGFRMKEEAEILNLSPNTVEKYRTNIRKKAGIHPISHLVR